MLALSSRHTNTVGHLLSQVDYGSFNTVFSVDMPSCSAKAMKEQQQQGTPVQVGNVNCKGIRRLYKLINFSPSPGSEVAVVHAKAQQPRQASVSQDASSPAEGQDAGEPP